MSGSSLTIDKYTNALSDYSSKIKKSTVIDGFQDFKKDIARAENNHPSVKIVICPFDFTSLYPSEATLQGKSLVGREVLELYKRKADDYVQVFKEKENDRHLLTHLVDRNYIHFASIAWTGTNKEVAQGIQGAIAQLSTSLFDDVEYSRGDDFTTAHAKLEGPGQAHPRNEMGEYDAFYNASFDANKIEWKAFLTNPAIEGFKFKLKRFFHRCFPHHARDYFEVASHPRFANVDPCGGFLWGIQSSLAINKETSSTITKPHRDVSNQVTNLCSVVPFGNFDPSQQNSGSLLLHDAKACIQLRPGDICFFPSALIAHSNNAMAEGHTRGSIVGFTHASIFRFVRLNFKVIGTASEEDVKRWYSESRQMWSYFANIYEKPFLTL